MFIKRPMTGVLAMLVLGELIGAWAGGFILLTVCAAAAAVLAVLIRRGRIWRRYLFLLFFLFLGYFRMEEIQKISHVPVDGICEVRGEVRKVVEKDGYSQLYLYDAVGFTKEEHRKLAGMILNVSEKDEGSRVEILPGDEVLAQVSPKRYETARNPGNFDAENYYATMNIMCFGWCDTITVLSKNDNPVTKGIFSLKERLKNVYGQIGTKEDRGVYQSLVLGDKSELDAQIKQLYQVNGIAHILAISGLHISILGMGLYRFLRKFCVPFPISFLIGSFVMVCYGVMTGNSVSTVRALIMFLVCISADVLGKSYDSISALALAAVLLLVPYPKLLWNSGFLLSFLAVTGVTVVKPALSEAFGNPRGKLLDAFLVSLGVSMTTLPVLLCAYYETAVYSVFLNLIIIPLMTFLMISVVFAGLTGLFSLTLGTVFVGTAHYILCFYQWICRAFEKLPGAVRVFGKPEPVLVFLYYLTLAAFVFVMCTTGREKADRIKKGRFSAVVPVV
ncbi:MAG: ComEC family competence protein, partial [Alistipes sp.]|nr:ComEC family competence protein [Alistipes sp.]